MKFTEEKLELAIIELLEVEGYEHVLGQNIVREPNEVLIKEDIRAYLFQGMQSTTLPPEKLSRLFGSLPFFLRQIFTKATRLS
jgi:type I restriction enzyme R subunit